MGRINCVLIFDSENQSGFESCNPFPEYQFARVAELVDALDLGSSSGDRVGVQVSPLAPVNKYKVPEELSEVRQ